MSTGLARTILWTAVLCVLGAASIIDLRRRVIPNEASAFVAVSGLALGLLARPAVAWISVAIAIALLVTLAFVSRLGLIGGGDAKLIAAVSLLVPPQGIAGLLLGIALAGGLLSLCYLVLRRVLGAGARPRRGRRHVRPRGGFARFMRGEGVRIRASHGVPYALAVFGGVVVYVLSELAQCSSATSCSL